MKFTDKAIRGLALPEGKTDHVHWDDELSGLGLRIRDGGSRSFIYRYRVGSKQRSIALGGTAIPLVTIRKNAAELQAKVRLGQDPAAERAKVRLEASNTFEALAGQYLSAKSEGGDWRARSAENVRRHLLVYAKPLHGKPVSTIALLDIANVLTAVAKNSGRASANRTRASLSAMFAWAIKQGLTTVNPVIGTERRKETSRKHVLSEDELRAIWTNCGSDDFGRCIRLLILTGARESEIGGLRWSEVRKHEILIPRERIKNGHDHQIPLIPAVRALLPARRNSDRLFGRSDAAHGFAGWSAAKRALDQRIADAGRRLAPWRIHDLRRSCATHMAKLGVQPHIIEACLNHRSGEIAGIAAVYNRHGYETEKRAALELWSAQIAQIIAA